MSEPRVSEVAEDLQGRGNQWDTDSTSYTTIPCFGLWQELALVLYGRAQHCFVWHLFAYFALKMDQIEFQDFPPVDFIGVQDKIRIFLILSMVCENACKSNPCMFDFSQHLSSSALASRVWHLQLFSHRKPSTLPIINFSSSNNSIISLPVSPSRPPLPNHILFVLQCPDQDHPLTSRLGHLQYSAVRQA